MSSVETLTVSFDLDNVRMIFSATAELNQVTFRHRTVCDVIFPGEQLN